MAMPAWRASCGACGEHDQTLSPRIGGKRFAGSHVAS